MSDCGSEDSLRLTLSPPRSHSHSDRTSESSSQNHPPHCENTDQRPRTTRSGERSSSSRLKKDRIAPPFPWATDRRAVLQPLRYLASNGVTSIDGFVACKRCNSVQRLEVELQPAFDRVRRYFIAHKDIMHDRAPRIWSIPRLLDCNVCKQSECAKPIIDGKKRNINWLFMLLTQTLGACKLEHLKYFCKHTRRHRTGAKDRVLYLTYVGLLKQLDPGGPYD